MSSLVIVAIPDENDRVWKISSDKIPHLTLLFLGDTDDVTNLDQIVGFVEHAANTTLRRFYLPVDRRGELGADRADVLFFKKGRYDYKAIRDFRASLLQDHNIKKAYDSATQFDGVWQPHLTLGYPAAPAKPEKEDFGFYDVSFNKIAVWTDEFKGPEFLLKDYADDYEALEVVPMDVSMSDIRMSDLEHFGVKGMRWGVRKDTQVTVNGKTKMVSARKAEKLEKKWEKNQFTLPKGIERHNMMADITNAKLENFNNDPRWAGKNLLTDKAAEKAYFDAYNKEIHEPAFRQAVEKVHGSSPTGKRKATVEVQGDELQLVIKDVKDVKHAAVGENDEVFLFRIVRDDNGFITSVQPVEDTENSITQTADLDSVLVSSLEVDEETLEHFGIKGMRWGVRKAAAGAKAVGRGVKTGAQKVGRGLKALGAELAESSWQNSIYSDDKHEAVHNHVAKDLDNRVVRLQTSPKYRGKNLRADSDLRKTYYEDVAKVTDSAYRRGVKDVYGENYKGTQRAHYVHDARGPRIEVRDKHTNEVAAESPLRSRSEIRLRREERERETAHAATSDFPDLSIDLKLDGNGQIVGVGFVKPSGEEAVAQSAIDVGEEFVLEHFGVKGMRWGVRKERSVPTAVTPTATSRVPHGKKRKTKIKTEGGENHPAHGDAVKVAMSRAKLSRSGTAALSNQELRDVANRLQLENQVAVLTSSRGKRFVSRQFEQESQQLARTGVRKAAPVVAKKAKKGAATVAVSALI